METNRIMDIIAYFLSEYDDKAVNALGYRNKAETFRKVAKKFGKRKHT